jgi:soluble lytic murein transglycosylase-like protein
MFLIIFSLFMIQANKDIEDAMQKASKITHVPLQIIRAVAYQESNFNPNAKSKAGALGLMQLMPIVIQNYNIQNPNDPFENALGGAKLLKSFHKQMNRDWPLTFAAYNWGPANIKNHSRNEWPTETKNYVSKIVKSIKNILAVL